MKVLKNSDTIRPSTTTSCPVVILEGPDGAGKTTLGLKLADTLHARYVHLGPMLKFNEDLSRLYVEAMLPALLGYQPVILDRAWHSELPYGQIMRGAADRIGPVRRRMLERIAMRCGAVVVRCLPPKDTVLENFTKESRDEYLERSEQLSQVYDYYANMGQPATELTIMSYDYTKVGETYQTVADDLDSYWARHRPFHAASMLSAGDINASTLIVGERFTEPYRQDMLAQYPFVSFSSSGCSPWLTSLLYEEDIEESSLAWVNADQLSGPDGKSFFFRMPNLANVVTLGQIADETVRKLKIAHTGMAHPQAWRRFHAGEPYPLIQFLKDFS